MNATAQSDLPKKNLLIKYVAHSGLCSRRKAEHLIKSGLISVNNFVIVNPGYELAEKDVVRYDKKVLTQEREFIYLVVNKPVNTLCTAHDPEGRPTIFDLLKHPKLNGTRLYTVGRLDRNTTGAIIVTNDGALAQRMTHPSFEIPKTYAATLHRPFTEDRLAQVKRGLDLEDGFVMVDHIAPVHERHTQTMLVTLHSGKNRIIRRIFEHVGFFVDALDRISIGPVSKKGLAKGEARMLNNKEIDALHKMLDRQKKQPRQNS